MSAVTGVPAPGEAMTWTRRARARAAAASPWAMTATSFWRAVRAAWASGVAAGRARATATAVASAGVKLTGGSVRVASTA